MCGRYALAYPDKLAERFQINDNESQDLMSAMRARYNVAPGQIMPVVISHGRQRHIELMQWGFMPPWAKSEREVFKYKTFNARSEGMFTSQLWKRSAVLRRCLVPASGFYEWRSTSTGKQPYFIRPKGQDLFAFAGLYRYWERAGSELGTYAIVTTGANAALSVIHNRMPVILSRVGERQWLDPAASPGSLMTLTASFRDSALSIHPVDRAVNTSRSDDAWLTRPLNSR